MSVSTPSNSTHVPPRVPGAPLVGNARSFLNNALSFLREQYRTFGPVFRMKLFTKEYWVLAGVEANQFLARADGTLLSSRNLYPLGEQLGSGKHFLIAQDGQWHATLRRMLSPGYSRRVYEQQIPRAVDITRRLVREWQPGSRITVMHEMQRIITAQLGEIVLGYPPPPEFFEDIRCYLNTALRTSTIPMAPPFLKWWPRYLLAKRRVRRLGARLLAAERARVARGEPPSSRLVKDLLAFRDEAGNPLPDHALQMSIIGVYFAGLDTVAGTMTCALYAAHKFPGVLERVMDDVNALFTRPLEAIDRMTLKKLQALYGFVLEVLRMFPIAPITPRVAAESFEFAGYTIPKGADVMVANALPHVLEEYFPNPDVFDIDRYTPERAEHRQSGAFAPFTLGAHTCLGAGIAESQLMMTTATILHTATLALESPDATVRMKFSPLPGPGFDFKMRVVDVR
nr:cytochrome P450 [Ardenticatena sp.]